MKVDVMPLDIFEQLTIMYTYKDATRVSYQHKSMHDFCMYGDTIHFLISSLFIHSPLEM